METNVVPLEQSNIVNHSAHGARRERVEEVCERVLEVSAVVLQHAITAATRQIALEGSDNCRSCKNVIPASSAHSRLHRRHSRRQVRRRVRLASALQFAAHRRRHRSCVHCVPFDLSLFNSLPVAHEQSNAWRMYGWTMIEYLYSSFNTSTRRISLSLPTAHAKISLIEIRSSGEGLSLLQHVVHITTGQSAHRLSIVRKRHDRRR